MSAVIRPDLTVVNSPPSAAAPGWAVRGLLDATFRELTTAFRIPDFGIDAIDDSTLWQLETPGGRAQLVSEKTGGYFLRAPDDVTTWMIQASSPDVLPWIFEILDPGVEAFVQSTLAAPAGSDRVALIRAYRHFLRLHAAAVAQRLGSLTAPPRAAAAARWRQLTTAHRALDRALYLAVTPQDVVAALRQLAERLESAERDPANDAGLHGEIVATIRSLATAELDRRVPA
ncbi:hypothetical protein CFP71_42210 [Amycolatopsis thailandensis]|uniref:Uncharacterized protein n=1 Tax=Amycolatopsis thailandensis TaxID=589330 RepID=A0A229R7Y0_9PSEU|nr:hypothetical protein [Amycolatopsis thailandensis]OXM42747.1 hypothetical protein CFP71_42210 [Amycolatopsis thailandensis]